MEILNIASTVLWFALAGYCSSVLYRLHQDTNDHQYVAITLMVLLLSGLNICIGLFTIFITSIKSDCSLLQNFMLGSSIFQILLCYCVVKRININSQNN